MSLHPEWAEEVFTGKKTVEFRRVVPVEPVSHVVVYATKPIGRVVGYFTVVRIAAGSPSALWTLYGKRGSISRRRFREYFTSKNQGFAIEIGEAIRFESTVSLTEIGAASAPQSFTYLESDQLSSVAGY